MNFQDKVVVVTGAGSGLGAAIALRFAELNANLCIIDKNESSLLKTKNECEELNQIKVKEFVADISEDDKVKTIVEDALKEFEKIDVLINCAGIFAPGNLQDSEVIAALDSIMAINVRAVIVMTKEVVPALIKSKGCIVNIASIAAKYEYIVHNNLPYGISKAAVAFFTKAAAYELAVHGIRVNSISPGPVKTNILLNAGVSEADHNTFWEIFRGQTALKKFVKAEEVAEMAVYLASDKAASITGSDFVIDAGTCLGKMNTVMVDLAKTA